jgi:hypothetical protein
VTYVVKPGDLVYARETALSGCLTQRGAYLPSTVSALITQGIAGTVTHPLGNVIRVEADGITYQIAEISDAIRPAYAPPPIPTLQGRRLISVRLSDAFINAAAGLAQVVGPTDEATNILRYNLLAESVPQSEASIVAHLHQYRNSNNRVLVDPNSGHVVHPMDAIASLRLARTCLANQAALHGT